VSPRTSRTGVTWLFNGLQPGVSYVATTDRGLQAGEYLGMETRYGDWAILLRNGRLTTSVALADIIEIVEEAA
jgi:hypothetical protein